MNSTIDIDFSKFYLIEFFSKIEEVVNARFEKDTAQKIGELLNNVNMDDDLVSALEPMAREHGTSELTIFIFDIVDRITDYPPTLVYDSIPEMVDDFVNTLEIMLEEEITLQAIEKINSQFKSLRHTEREPEEKEITEKPEMIEEKPVEEEAEPEFLSEKEKKKTEKETEDEAVLEKEITFDEFMVFEKLKAKLNEEYELQETSLLLDFCRLLYNDPAQSLPENAPKEVSSLLEYFSQIKEWLEKEKIADLEKKLSGQYKNITANLDALYKSNPEIFHNSLEKQKLTIPKRVTRKEEVPEKPVTIESLLSSYFQTEVEEHVGKFKSLIKELSKNLTDKDAINKLDKRFHSFKEISMIHGYEIFENACGQIIFHIQSIKNKEKYLSANTLEILKKILTNIENSDKYRGKLKNSHESEEFDLLIQEFLDNLEESPPKIKEEQKKEKEKAQKKDKEEKKPETREPDKEPQIAYKDQNKILEIFTDSINNYKENLLKFLKKKDDKNKEKAIETVEHIIYASELLENKNINKFLSVFLQHLSDTAAEDLQKLADVFSTSFGQFTAAFGKKELENAIKNLGEISAETISFQNKSALVSVLMEIEKQNFSDYQKKLNEIFISRNDSETETQKNHFENLSKNFALLELSKLNNFPEYFIKLFNQSTEYELDDDDIKNIAEAYYGIIDEIGKKGENAETNSILDDLTESINKSAEEIPQEEEIKIEQEDTEPAAETSEDEEENLEEIFIDEVESYLKNADTAYSLIQNNPSDYEALHDIERNIHSIKSSARLMGYDTFASLLVPLESFCEHYASAKKLLEKEKIPVLGDVLEKVKNLVHSGEFKERDLSEEQNEFDEKLVYKQEIDLADAQTEEELVASPEEKPLFAATPDTDEDMLEIFKEESGQFIQQVEESIDNLKEDPQNADALHKLEYASHSLKSAAKMLGFSEIGNLSDGIENIAEATAKQEISLTSEVHDNLQAAHAMIKLLSGGEKASQSDIGDLIQLLNVKQIALKQSKDKKPEKAEKEEYETRDDVDQMMDLFLNESRDLLEKINNDLVQFETDKSEELIDRINRHLHTLKGSAQMFGMSKIGKITHKVEDIFNLLLDNMSLVPKVTIDPVFAAMDEVQSILNSIKAGKGEVSVSFESVLETLGRMQKQIESGEFEEDKSKTKKTEETDIESEREIKVSTNYLDNLINMAAELVVNKTQLNAYLEHLRNISSNIDKNKDTFVKTGYKLDDFATKYSDQDEIKNVVNEFKTLGFSIDTISNDFTSLAQEFEKNISRISNLSKMLHDDILQVRMVPINTLYNRFPRTVRDIAKSQDKKVKLSFEGRKTEMDRAMVEAIYDPVLHLLRNAIDHGIEPPQERKKAGKAEEGLILVKAWQQKTNIIIEISDDGRGLDIDAIRQKVLEKKLVAKKDIDTVTEDEIIQFIFQPGFSTKKEVSQVSGRGVGLDIVAENIKKLKGDVQVKSEPNKGSTFILRVPLTLVIAQAMMISIYDQIMAMPISDVEKTIQFKKDDIEEKENVKLIEIDGNKLQLIFPAEVIKFEHEKETEEQNILNGIITEDGGERYVFVVDRILGREEIVIKSLGEQLQNLDYIAGGTILGDGSVGLILDVPAIIEKFRKEARQGAAKKEPASREEAPEEIKSKEKPAVKKDKPLALIVDDSISVRRFVGAVLERNEFTTVLASDGMEALSKLKEHDFDIVVTDLEMPKMHGYELIQEIRKQEIYSDLPIVILTGRAGQKHRDMGMKLGANSFIVKPFKEADLVATLKKYV